MPITSKEAEEIGSKEEKKAGEVEPSLEGDK